jgi:hypothetical protein
LGLKSQEEDVPLTLEDVRNAVRDEIAAAMKANAESEDKAKNKKVTSEDKKAGVAPEDKGKVAAGAPEDQPPVEPKSVVETDAAADPEETSTSTTVRQNPADTHGVYSNEAGDESHAATTTIVNPAETHAEGPNASPDVAAGNPRRDESTVASEVSTTEVNPAETHPDAPNEEHEGELAAGKPRGDESELYAAAKEEIAALKEQIAEFEAFKEDVLRRMPRAARKSLIGQDGDEEVQKISDERKPLSQEYDLYGRRLRRKK